MPSRQQCPDRRHVPAGTRFEAPRTFGERFDRRDATAQPVIERSSELELPEHRRAVAQRPLERGAWDTGAAGNVRLVKASTSVKPDAAHFRPLTPADGDLDQRFGRVLEGPEP